MNLKSFTKEEQAFAEENHNLVYVFLNEKKLSECDFYDIVIFGYLRAVQEYCRSSSLSKYKFSTLAWRRMYHILMDYYKYLESPKRKAMVLSLEECIEYEREGPDEGNTVYDIMFEEREDFLMHELAQNLQPREMRIVKMKARGDKMHDIAKSERMTFQEINRVLCNIYPTVREIFYG